VFGYNDWNHILDKATKRAHKLAHQQTTVVEPMITGPIDCACVIHGNAYDWSYVEHLYNMLSRHITAGIRLHVYTEAERTVPAPMIKHELIPWQLKRANRGWWYKMQLFNTQHHSGPLLYFDLDTVIVSNIDWICHQSPTHFCTVRDFKYLWRANHVGINSSVMWWNTKNYQYVWDSFCAQDLDNMVRRHHGDQDFLTATIPYNQCRYLDVNRVQSWRWQCVDGGYDFRRRRHNCPGTGTQIADNTSVLVFHGRPKPADITDAVILQHWQ
jgi:hypothetical protein